jgi:hypothetical protein
LIAEAANLMNAISWNNTGNKAMLAAKGCCEALMEALLKLANHKEPDDLICFERVGYSLASLMLFPSNHERLLSKFIHEKNVYFALAFF